LIRGATASTPDFLGRVAATGGRKTASEPLVAAAARLLNRSSPTRVLILTGAAVTDYMPVGENDGPIGTAGVAARLGRCTAGHEHRP
jgi:hypothetical protein